MAAGSGGRSSLSRLLGAKIPRVVRGGIVDVRGDGERKERTLQPGQWELPLMAVVQERKRIVLIRCEGLQKLENA